MFGSLGGTEILFILVLALLLFGPRKLPQIGRSLGRAMAELRKATTDFKMSLEREIEVEKLRETGSAVRQAGRDMEQALRGTVPTPNGGKASPVPPTEGPPAEAEATPERPDDPSDSTVAPGPKANPTKPDTPTDPADPAR